MNHSSNFRVSSTLFATRCRVSLGIPFYAANECRLFQISVASIYVFQGELEKEGISMEGISIISFMKVFTLQF